MSSDAATAGAGEGAGAGAAKKTQMPPWRMPELMSTGLDYWKKHYPLRMSNSLTRKKDIFVPINGKRVLWYMCGPTVYDLSHLGHARTYLSFDIVRRIMTDYFGYDVIQVMNITDIDDKIIDRSNQAGIEFNELARKFEKEYMDDMAALGVLPPDCLTRVSEYIPDVIEFVAKIVERGYGYESNGSVYFDTTTFNAAKQHHYGKLVPENVGNENALAEGEGHAAAFASEKRSSSDFALWKASKPGEPTWESPWGPGRPGWHIECSAMSGSSLKGFEGGAIDIHSGGTDLRFPHHDNELAQSEAYFDFGQWVNYFVHSGHLEIEGRKMGKSLKNFITIREALEDYSARALRMFYLLHRYNVRMDYSKEGMDQAAVMDSKFNEFFLNMKAILRSTPLTSVQRWDAEEIELAKALSETKRAVAEALADDFDTPTAMRVLFDLVKATNLYVALPKPNVSLLLKSIGDFMTKMFRTFGLVDSHPSIGYKVKGAAGGGDLEATLAPYLTAFSNFRDDVRGAAREGDTAKLLKLCDLLRDEVLPGLGVRLEDSTDGGNSSWKLVSAEEVEREKAEKEAQAKAAAERKAAAKKKEAERAAAAATNPADLFRGDAAYSQFDDDGVPTHDAEGKPLAKSQIKKLKKKFLAQKKKYDKFLAKQAK